LHDRLLAPIYPLAFLVLVFALIGTARTTRQSRLFATALALLGVLALRLIGFACIIFAMQTRAMLLLLYGSVILTLGFGVWAIHHGGVVIDSPRLLARLASRSRDPAGAPAR
jgi:lipopolysaccharide export system permease protein